MSLESKTKDFAFDFRLQTLDSRLFSYEDSDRQIREHRGHRAHAAFSGGDEARAAACGNLVGRGKARRGNFERQPVRGSSHRSRHEGFEALADVWGDAAGTASAVTSATRLILRYRTRFSRTT